MPENYYTINKIITLQTFMLAILFYKVEPLKKMLTRNILRLIDDGRNLNNLVSLNDLYLTVLLY